MKKPVKKYKEINLEVQMASSEAEEKFYMCEYIDAYAARPDRREIRDLEMHIN